MAENVPSWQNLGPRFSNDSLHENLRAARQISCAASLPRKIVEHSQNRTQRMYGGDCDAAIAKAAAAVIHVQSQGEERLVLAMKDWACCVLICHQQKRTFGGWRTNSGRDFAFSLLGKL